MNSGSVAGYETRLPARPQGFGEGKNDQSQALVIKLRVSPESHHELVVDLHDNISCDF